MAFISQDETSSELYWKVPLAKLSSTVISEIAEAKEKIHQLLLTDSRDNNVILGDLFHLYVTANCSAASEILLDQSRPHHVNFLFEKMNDSFKNSERKYQILMLFWSIIQRQPSWLHTIISTAFFNSFIKCLKADNDAVILMTGILIVTSLLPSIPSLVGSFLVDFFDIFERIFLFTVRRRGFIPDTHLLHLQVASHVLFHRLYAMYPNNTVSFMKSFYESTHDKEVDWAMESLLKWAKFHPWLITETEQTEISNSRWRSKEPHDVVIDCEKVSLDPTDCPLQETETLSLLCHSRQSFSDGNPSESSGIWTGSDNSVQQAAHDEDRLDTATQTGTSLQNATYHKRMCSFDSGTDVPNSTPLIASNAMFCSPTTFCSLTTPPPSQDGSPTESTLDVSIGNNFSNSSPAHNYSIICSSNIELSDLKTTYSTPNHGTRRSNMNATRCATETAGDLSICGNTTPVIATTEDTAKHKRSISNDGIRTLNMNATRQSSRCATETVGDSSISSGNTTPTTEDTGKHKRSVPNDGTRGLNVKATPQRSPCCDTVVDGVVDGSTEESSEDVVDESSSDDKELRTERSPGSVEKDSKYKAKFPGEMLEFVLPFACCRHCRDNGRSSNKGKLDWESQLSPTQLLDEYLKFGKSLQENRLNRIPLTCQGGAEWTHFGGRPPVDEITLLRSELLLLQSEVLFERHKCVLHATRNRRLVGKVFQTNAVKEELIAIKEQMKLLEAEMVCLEHTQKEKLAENRKSKERAESLNSTERKEFSNLLRTNECLTIEKQELHEDVKRFRYENEKLQVELKEAKARISELENDMSRFKRLESENGLLKSQADMQSKNLLIMGEREEQLKDIIGVLKSTVKNSPEHKTKLLIYKKELEASNTLVNEQKADLIHARSSISEMESGLVQKDHHIRDLKKSIENIKTSWKDKLEAVESKYQSIKRANQRLESEVMSLHSKLGARTKDR